MKLTRMMWLFVAIVGVSFFELAPAAEGPAMLPLMGKHSRCIKECGYQFTEEATYSRIGTVRHPGWDMNLSVPNDDGQPVYAIADGTVVDAESNTPDEWGSVVIEHNVNGQHFYSQYGHCQEVFVKDGQVVKKGNRIGRVGGVPDYDPHLHWEIRWTYPTHPDPQNRNYFGGPNGTFIKSFNNVVAAYRNPERMIVRLDIDAERQSQGVSNYRDLVKDNDWFIPLDDIHPYNSDNTPKSCYVQKWSGGSFGACGIIFDALGGTRTAYTVRNGFWGTWNASGGPSSSVGIPITNEYPIPGGSRQDFQKGYFTWNGSSVSVKYYLNGAPGWTSSGWNNQYSYLFARAYERNGARNTLGEASGNVYGWNGFQRQNFAAGHCIIYDPNNADGNPAATNEAYYLAGNFYQTYMTIAEVGPAVLGAPTRDREGNVQYFKRGRMEERSGTVYAYNASGTQIWPTTVHISGGPVDPYADLTVLYNYGGCQTRAHTFLSTGSAFQYQTNDGWATINNYCLEYVVRNLSGDFNGDGLSDIAMLYKYGECSVGIHMLLSTGTGYTYQAWWWQSEGYCTYAIKGAAAGDFNGDGKDDIAFAYNYGSCQTRIHVLLSTGSTFVYQGNEGWFNAAGWYCAEQVKFMSAGDLNGDGGDDIVLAYSYGSSSTALHVFLTNGTSFNYYGNSWFFADGWFALDAMKFMEMGDLNADGKCDLVMACRYGPSETALLAFISTGSSFSYQGWWWHFDSFSLDAMPYMQVGDITGDGRADVAIACRYGEYSAAIHCFVSTGSNFTYQPYWWQSEGYGWYATNGFLIGRLNAGGLAKTSSEGSDPPLPLAFALNQNYPNPFNPVTTISYALPASAHVTLDIFNILGERVTTLVDADQSAGDYQISWDASSYASGVYFYRLQAGEATETKKMLFLK